MRFLRREPPTSSTNNLIRRIPDLKVPVRFQQEWLDTIDRVVTRARTERVRGRGARRHDDAVLDLQTRPGGPDRALPARARCSAGTDPRQEGPEGERRQVPAAEAQVARAQLTDPVARLRGKLDTCGMPSDRARAVEARARPPLSQDRREDDGVPAVSGRPAVDRRQGGLDRSRTRPQRPRRTSLRTPGSEGAHPRTRCRAAPET